MRELGAALTSAETPKWSMAGSGTSSPPVRSLGRGNCAWLTLAWPITHASGFAPTIWARSGALNAAAGGIVTLPVYVEVNMGGNCCGVEPGEPALDRARRIAEAPHLAFAGL